MGWKSQFSEARNKLCAIAACARSWWSWASAIRKSLSVLWQGLRKSDSSLSPAARSRRAPDRQPQTTSLRGRDNDGGMSAQVASDDDLVRLISMKCRICRSGNIEKVGDVEFFIDHAMPIFD